MAVVLVVVVVGILQAINLNVYAITPGSATPVAPSVSIRGVQHESRSSFYLVDVWLQQLNAWQWLTMHLQQHVEFVPGSWLTAPGIPTSQLNAQGYLDMYQAKEFAEAEAFRTVGWSVPDLGAGALIYGIISHTPASRSRLRVGDVVTAVNGVPVTNACSMLRAMSHVAPHSMVTLTLDKVHITDAGTVTYAAAPQTLRVRTEPNPSPSAATGCSGVRRLPSDIGMSIQDAWRYHYPANVTINTANIGGPSAGLAMTLTLIDELTKGSLSNGEKIAVTGTMDNYGNVGDVGGVAEKTVAAARAGARLFIVPSVEVKTALANAPASLHVVGVNTLTQALDDLRALGGSAWPLRPVSPVTKTF